MDDKKIWRKSERPEKVVLLSNLVLPSGSRGSSPSSSSVFSTSFKHETRLTLTDEHHCEGSLGVRARTRHAKSFNRAKGRAARPVLYRYRHTFYSVCTRTHIWSTHTHMKYAHIYLRARTHTYTHTHAHVALAATRRDVVRPAAAKGRADLPSQPPTPSPPRRPFAAGWSPPSPPLPSVAAPPSRCTDVWRALQLPLQPPRFTECAKPVEKRRETAHRDAVVVAVVSLVSGGRLGR